MIQLSQITLLSLSLGLLVACGSSSSSQAPSAPDQTSLPTPAVTSETTKLNQLGYLPVGEKIAIVPNVNSAQFELIQVNTNQSVYQGTLSTSQQWQPAGSERFKRADFSGFSTPGRYVLKVEGVTPSTEFEIGKDVYSALNDAVLKAYYFNRASSAITSTYGEQWTRPAGHPDQAVKVHASAASASRPEGSTLSATKGWYDAGDYGKYVVNSGISTYTMMAAFEHHPAYYANRDINIPESGDGVPDILDEAKWNLDWLATMQDADGGVYHKLTTLEWPGIEMPHQDLRERYVIGKSTSAALNYAATLAMASRIYKPYEFAFPGASAGWLSAAEAAWQWAVANPQQAYVQPSDVQSGEYGDSKFDDEFAWAAAELYVTTLDEKYLQAFNSYHQQINTPFWREVSALPVITLLQKGKESLDTITYESLKSQLLQLADALLTQYQQSSYAVAMEESDFVWGSNAVALNKAVILMQAYKLTAKAEYRHAAQGAVSYLLGRNPTGYSFVTGFGSKSTRAPHHRLSESDGVTAPVPGMVAGGPNSGRQDGCNYSSTQPAKSYLDDWCSYSTNEVAINWNAPLIYLLAALQAE